MALRCLAFWSAAACQHPCWRICKACAVPHPASKSCHTCMLQRQSIDNILSSVSPMVQEAGVTRRPTKRTPEQRVDLREQCVLGSAPGSLDNRISIVNGPPVAPMSSLPAVTEDGAEGQPVPADSISCQSFVKVQCFGQACVCLLPPMVEVLVQMQPVEVFHLLEGGTFRHLNFVALFGTADMWQGCSRRVKMHCRRRQI
jgi:hypothetical protein